MKSEQLTPGLLKIPAFIDSTKYENPRSNKYFLSLIPKHEYRVYENGKFVGIEIVESVRRDILAFDCLFKNLRSISGWFLSREGREFYKNNPKSISNFPNIIKSLAPEFRDRKVSCVALFASETDRQAVRIAEGFIGQIDDWLAHMNEKLGIDDAGNLI